MKKSLIFFLILNLLFSSLSIAQDEEQADDLVKNTQQDILTVAAAGVGGAIIGLSTLSFVSRPSRHISNIWTGAALGVIAGVIFVGYNSAQKGSEDLQSSAEFNSLERFAWHEDSTPFLGLDSQPSLSFSQSF